MIFQNLKVARQPLHAVFDTFKALDGSLVLRSCRACRNGAGGKDNHKDQDYPAIQAQESHGVRLNAFLCDALSVSQVIDIDPDAVTLLDKLRHENGQTVIQFGFLVI